MSEANVANPLANRFRTRCLPGLCGKLLLERELRAKAERRRRLHDLRRSIKWIGHRRHSGHSAINREGLVQGDRSLTIEDIEPITTETQLTLFTNLDWIVNTQIKVHGRGRAIRAHALDPVREAGFSRSHDRNDRRPARHAHALVISIDYVRYQRIEGSAGLNVVIAADQQPPRSSITAVELELVRTIVRQPAISVVQQALQIEQRSDVRISLAIIVAEQAFVVAGETRVNVRSD